MIVPKGSSPKWEQYNLYQHSFNELIASLAFTGDAQITSKDIILNSPEFTTNGALPKKWVRRNKQIFLMKGTGESANNNDGRIEPFSEMYTSQLAEYLKLPHVSYQVEVFKHSNGQEEFVSICPLYTTENKSYIPVAKLLNKRHIDYRMIATEREQKKIAAIFKDQSYFSNMIMFDCLIGNTDRHLNNFGVIVDANTNKILEPMPIFDNGNALWLGMYLKPLEENPKRVFESEWTAFDIPAPLLYKRFKKPEQKEMLETIKDFQFIKETPYKLSDHTLEVLENNIRIRAQIMLKMLEEK